MKLNVDEIIDEGTVFIVQWPTGIKYTAQTGGISCEHPECEGFLLKLSEFLQDFDDCSYGCQHLWEMPDARLKLADDLDQYFKDNRLGYIQIDRDRLKELSEGWWPVHYNASIGGDGSYDGKKQGPFKGYIHTGNCD